MQDDFGDKELFKFAIKKYEAPIFFLIIIALIFVYINSVASPQDVQPNSLIDHDENLQEAIAQENAQQQQDEAQPDLKEVPPQPKQECPLGCYDDDNGVNTGQLGRIIYGTNQTCINQYDRCVNYKQLEEFYCVDGMIQSEFITCKGSCVDGVCVT